MHHWNLHVRWLFFRGLFQVHFRTKILDSFFHLKSLIFNHKPPSIQVGLRCENIPHWKKMFHTDARLSLVPLPLLSPGQSCCKSPPYFIPLFSSWNLLLPEAVSFSSLVSRCVHLKSAEPHWPGVLPTTSEVAVQADFRQLKGPFSSMANWDTCDNS